MLISEAKSKALLKPGFHIIVFDVKIVSTETLDVYMETLFSDDRGDPCDRNDPCVWIVRDRTRVYLGRSIRKDRFYLKPGFHMIVSDVRIVAVASNF